MTANQFVQWGAPWLVALVASALAIACGGQSTPVKDTTHVEPAAVVPREVHEQITPHTCPARRKLAELLGHTSTPPTPTSERAVDSAPPPPSTVGTTKIAANQAYRTVAPATVLIRTDDGIGTGAVIDPRGYILTNYHVIADGRKEDFVISANVTFGDLTPTGRMARQEKTYEAVVVKGDPIRDMAILKLKEPPPNLTAVKLAKSAPQIAEKVISVGHAGIGFLWAAKTCSIASVGERQHDTSRLAAFDCSNPDPSLSKKEAARFKERCDETKKAITEAYAAITQGVAIQTDCAITHGDSGGPLVNTAGEMVGLNQSISADIATAAFHVHVDEIRDFISKYPEDGVAIVPDPFCDGGSNTTLEDIDLDGIPDTVISKGSSEVFGGFDRWSLLIDLEQTHFARMQKNGTGDVTEPFKGQIAVLNVNKATYVWYETSGDKHFDLLLVDKDSDGQPEQAFRIDENGKLKEDKKALPKHDLSAKFVENSALHARLGKIATTLGGMKYVSAKTAAASKEQLSLPDPILGGGTQGRAIDSDGNGKADSAMMRGAFSRALLIDADEDTLGSLKSGDSVDDLVKTKKVDAEMSIVSQGNNVWAFYDTDNDANFDLVLMTTNGTFFTTNAWRLSSNGERTPAPDQIGRKMLRPGLLPAFPRVVAALRSLGADVATDEAMGSLPDPRISPKARFRVHELKGFPATTMIEATEGNTTAILIDVDHDTKMPKAAKTAQTTNAAKTVNTKGGIDESKLSELVANGKFDAEIAIVQKSGQDGVDYVYYDTDNDGKFDFVLLSPRSAKEATQAYRLKTPTDTKIEADPAAVAGRMLRYKTIFKNKALGLKWKAIATKAFQSTVIEE
ncbi:MAG: serine protease [Polyangiaceae bacterium]|nr:serine protease [Polyangiaceae bacterium]